MAFTEFYMQDTGSNLNAGSTNGNTSVSTFASGNWVQATRVFTLAGADLSGVSVGNWASVYPNGNTTTPFIGQITAVDDGADTITISATVSFGTAPTDGTGTRTLKVGGAWADFGMLASGVALNTGTTPVAMRVNVKVHSGAGYANTTTSRTFALAGTAVLPIWWRGYNSAIGDLDTDWSTAPPLITFTTGQVTLSGDHQVFSNLSITSQATAAGGAASLTGNSLQMDRIRIENTASNSASRAVTFSGCDFGRATRCWFKATTTADAVAHVNNTFGTHIAIASTYMTGGVACFKSVSTVPCVMVLANCQFISPATYGIHLTSVVDEYALSVIGCTLYGAGAATDGIRIDLITGAYPVLLANNVIANFTGYGINNSTGTYTTNFARLANDFYSCTSGNENGFGDHPAFAGVTESSSPFTNAGGGDFSLVTGASAIAGGSPGNIENTSLVGYMDCGALQKQSSGSSGIAATGDMVGGFIG